MTFDRSLIKFIDNIRIKHLFYIWIVINVLFGFLYFLVSQNFDNHLLLYRGYPVVTDFWGLLDCIYFSFVTSTTLGFGDIAPVGALRLLTIVQAAGGLLLLSFIISKMVSKKQQLLLEQIYHSSFEEKIRTLRSGLYLFRENMEKLNDEIKHNHEKKNEIIEKLNLKFVSLYTHLNELHKLLSDENHHKLKNVDGEKLLLHISLSLSIIIHCFKILEIRKVKLESEELHISLQLIENGIQKISKHLHDNNYTDKIDELSHRTKLRIKQLKDASSEVLA